MMEGKVSRLHYMERQDVAGRSHHVGQKERKRDSEQIQSEETPPNISSEESVLSRTVKTFIFLDLEATGLNQYPKITEMCLIAVHVSSLENPVTNESGEVQLPRIMDKLCLCVDPGKPIQQEASRITGLSNENLGINEKHKFDINVINIIKEFVNRQAQPVCLVAHDGFFFDFPLLKIELLQQNEDFPGTMLCLDSAKAFRHLDDPASQNIIGRYKLSEIYRRKFGKEPSFSHFAEADVLTLILVFIDQAREMRDVPCYRTWEEIRPMYHLDAHP